MSEKRKSNKDYCQYYSPTQKECPYKRGYKRIVWESEKHVCETEDNARNASEFLHLVASAIGENDKETIANYIAKESRYLSNALPDSTPEKILEKICQTYNLQNILFFEKPKGKTVFEYIDEGGFPCRTRGYLLYFDGRVYSIYENSPINVRMYILEGIHKTLSEKVKVFIRENCEAIQKLPKETSHACCCDGSFQYYKLLSKRCHGYMMELTEDGKKVLHFAKKIDYLFHYHDFPLNALEPNDFIECWDAFMDKVITDKKGEKILDFICHGGFAEDCEVLGFDMDCFESFYKKYGNDFFNKYGDENLERVFSLIDDYQILGNAIYSQWRYYNHWATDPIAEFDANWFKAAFKRLKELWEK